MIEAIERLSESAARAGYVIARDEPWEEAVATMREAEARLRVILMDRWPTGKAPVLKTGEA